MGIYNSIKAKNKRLNRNLKYPWIKHLHACRQRCNNVNAINYSYYGGRGIKCFLTLDKIKELWFRDRAFEMKHPSIDRKDRDGNYTFDNCQFIELNENISRASRKIIIQYDLNGNFIKEWKSITEASRKTKQDRSSIHDCLNQNVKQNKGCIWRYKHVA